MSAASTTIASIPPTLTTATSVAPASTQPSSPTTISTPTSPTSTAPTSTPTTIPTSTTPTTTPTSTTPTSTPTSTTPTSTTPTSTTPTSTIPTSTIPTSTIPTSTTPTLTPTSTIPTSTTPSSTPTSTTPITTPTSTTPTPTTPTSTTPTPTTPTSTTPTSTTPTSTTPTPTSTTPTPTSTPTSTSTSSSATSIFTPRPTTLASSQQTSDVPNTNTPSTTPIITTDGRGRTTSTEAVTTVITVITSFSLSTDVNNGQLSTVTEIHTFTSIIPTLHSNSNSNVSQGNSTFFHNTGAVAGVFVLVGLAVASIILWIFFAIRSRRRTQRLEHDADVAATLTAAGFHRTPLDDDDDPAQESGHSRYGSADPFLHQRRSSSGLAMSSLPSAGRMSTAFPDADNDPQIFHAYSDYSAPAASNDPQIFRAYSDYSTPVSSPPFIYRTRSSSNTMGENITGHAPQHSGSHEPLLAPYSHTSPPPSPPGVGHPQRPDAAKNPPALSNKPQNSNAAAKASPSSSAYSSENNGDHRLDPNLRQRLQDDADSFRDLRDEEDYSRPVLGVRNIPDTSSLASIP